MVRGGGIPEFSSLPPRAALSLFTPLPAGLVNRVSDFIGKNSTEPAGKCKERHLSRNASTFLALHITCQKVLCLRLEQVEAIVSDHIRLDQGYRVQGPLRELDPVVTNSEIFILESLILPRALALICITALGLMSGNELRPLDELLSYPEPATD